jgi:hypothetical protein
MLRTACDLRQFNFEAFLWAMDERQASRMRKVRELLLNTPGSCLPEAVIGSGVTAQPGPRKPAKDSGIFSWRIKRFLCARISSSRKSLPRSWGAWTTRISPQRPTCHDYNPPDLRDHSRRHARRMPFNWVPLLKVGAGESTITSHIGPGSIAPRRLATCLAESGGSGI